MLILKKKLLYVLSLITLVASCAMLAYGAYLFFYPQYTVTIERIAPPSPALRSWQKDLICSRTHPTPLFLNFYGDYIDRKIIVMFGREKEISRIILYPAVAGANGKQNISRYAALADGTLKDADKLGANENTEYMKSLTLSLDEEKFLRGCLERAETPKFEI